MIIETVAVFSYMNSAAMNILVKKHSVLGRVHTGSGESIVKFSGIL